MQELGHLVALRLACARITLLAIRGSYLAIIVTQVAHEDQDTVRELVLGALPVDHSSTLFSYPSDWYETDNVAPFSFKHEVILGTDYLKSCADHSRRTQSLLERSGRSSLWLEPVFFLPTPLWKRMMDIALAGTALVLLAPLLALISILIKIFSSGPLLFWQARHGGAGRKFRMCKFRTMNIDFDASEHSRHLQDLLETGQPLRKLAVDQVLIPHAKWIRAMGLDELPQLWNVLKGDMSVVGPRPDVVVIENYERWQRRRFDVVPGLTGLWQVSGKNKTTFEQMMGFDIEYIETRSMWNDASIILKTLPAIVRVALD